MNALAPIPNTQSVPQLPPGLAAKVEAVAPRRFPGAGSDDPGFRLPPHVEHDPTAASYLAQFERVCRPSEPTAIRVWCTRLARAVRNTPSEHDFAFRSAAIAEVCVDFPAAVWTSETLTEAMRTFEWWPSAKDAYNFLKPRADELIRTRDALRRMAEPPTPSLPPPPRREPDNEAKLAVSQLVHSFVAERTWKQPEAQRSQAGGVSASPLSDGALLAAYEQSAKQGGIAGGAAKIRAAMLRAKIAADAWRGDAEPGEAG